MARLVYGTLCSLDGYAADVDGHFDWSAPDPEVHAFVNTLEAEIGTSIYGRKLYEVMKVWETYEGEHAAEHDYARLWRAMDKVVVSSTLHAVDTARTTLVPHLDTAAIARLKAEATRDIGIGGPTRAAEAIRAGLVDEYYWLLSPVLVGGGLRALPDGVRLSLELIDERRFGNGVVYMRYRSKARS